MGFIIKALLCQALMLLGAMAAAETSTSTTTITTCGSPATSTSDQSSIYTTCATSTATVTLTSCTSVASSSTVLYGTVSIEPSATQWSASVSPYNGGSNGTAPNTITVTSTYTLRVCTSTLAPSAGFLNTTSASFATGAYPTATASATGYTVAPYTGEAAGSLGRVAASLVGLVMLAICMFHDM